MESTLLQTDLDNIAHVVRERRIELGWSKEQAARSAGISSITWKRVEDGLRVQDAKLAQVFRAIGLHAVAARGGLVKATPDFAGISVQAPNLPTGLDVAVVNATRRVAALRKELEVAESVLRQLSDQLMNEGYAPPDIDPARAQEARDQLAETAPNAAARKDEGPESEPAPEIHPEVI